MISTTTLSRMCENLEKYVFDRVWNDPYAEYRTYTTPDMLNAVPVGGHMSGRYSTILLPPERGFTLTSDSTFVSPKTYYTLSSVGTYVPAEVTYGEAIPAKTYYELDADDYTVYMDRRRSKYYVFAVTSAMFGAAYINAISWTPLSDYCNENFPDLQLFTKSGIFLNKGNVFIKQSDKRDCILFAVESDMFEKVVGKLGRVRCTDSKVVVTKNIYVRTVDDGYNIYWQKAVFTDNTSKERTTAYATGNNYYHYNSTGNFYGKLSLRSEEEFAAAVDEYGRVYTDGTTSVNTRVVVDDLFSGDGSTEHPYKFLADNVYYEDDEVIFGKYYDSDNEADNKILSYMVTSSLYSSIHRGSNLYGIDTSTYSLCNGKLITGDPTDYQSDIKAGDYIDSVTDEDVVGVVTAYCFDKETYKLDTTGGWRTGVQYYQRKQNPVGFGFIYVAVEINSGVEYFNALSRFGALYVKEEEVATTYVDADGTEKLLVHIPKEYNPEHFLITQQTCDIWLVPRKLRKWNPDDDTEVVPNPHLSGVYVYPCGNEDKFSQITFNDFSIDMNYIRTLANENLMVDGEYEVRVYVRWHKRQKVAIRDANYTDLLYSLGDAEITSFLHGTHEQQLEGNLLFWRASNLASSKYTEALLRRRNKVWQKASTQCDMCGLSDRCTLVRRDDTGAIIPITDHVCPNYTLRGLRDFIEILGYYHVLSLVANRVTHFRVTREGSHSVVVDTPLAHAGTDMTSIDYYPVVYHNGYRVSQDRISFGESSAGVSGVSEIVHETHELYDNGIVRPEFGSKLKIDITPHYSVSEDIVFLHDKHYFVRGDDGKMSLLHGCNRRVYDRMCDWYGNPLDNRNNYQYRYGDFVSERTVALCNDADVFKADTKYVMIPISHVTDGMRETDDEYFYPDTCYYRRKETATDGSETSSFELMKGGTYEQFKKDPANYQYYFPYCDVTKDTVFNKDKLYFVDAGKTYKSDLIYYHKVRYTVNDDGTIVKTNVKDITSPGNFELVELPGKGGRRVPGRLYPDGDGGCTEFKEAMELYGTLYRGYTVFPIKGKDQPIPTTVRVYEQFAMKTADYASTAYNKYTGELRGPVEELTKGFDYTDGEPVSNLIASYGRQGKSVRVGTYTGLEIYETDDEYHVNDTICVELLDDRKSGQLRYIDYPAGTVGDVVVDLASEDQWQLYEVSSKSVYGLGDKPVAWYKPVKYAEAGTVDFNELTGDYSLTIDVGLMGKRLLLVDGPLVEDTVKVESIDADRFGVLGGNVADWTKTDTFDDRAATDFPMEDEIVFLNGRRLIKGVDYAFDGKINDDYYAAALFNQNLSYLKASNTFNVLRNNLTTVSRQHGFLKGPVITSTGETPLWFSELSILTVDGRVCSYFKHDLGSVTISDNARSSNGELIYRNGAPYEIRVAASTRVVETLANQDLKTKDEDKLAQLVKFFSKPIEDVEIETIIPHSHKLYSIAVEAIIDEFLHNKTFDFSLIGEGSITDQTAFFNQFFKSSKTLLNGWTLPDLLIRDVVGTMKVAGVDKINENDLNFVDIYSMYHRAPSEYRENYARLQELHRQLTLNDKVKHKDAEHV